MLRGSVSDSLSDNQKYKILSKSFNDFSVYQNFIKAQNLFSRCSVNSNFVSENRSLTMKKLLWKTLLILIAAKSLVALDDEQKLKNIYSLAGKLDLSLEKLFSNISNHVNKYDEKFSSASFDDARCVQHLEAFQEGLATMEAWALTSN
jgi:hypothetical protein